MVEQAEPTKEKIEEIAQQEKVLAEAFGKEFLSLPKDLESQLSKVLFPDTFTFEVEILGKKRALKALPLKYSKQIHHSLLPFTEAKKKADESKEIVQLDLLVVDALKEVAKVLSVFYGWADVPKAVEDEELTLKELQALAVTQERIEGASNFLLGSLRIIIRLLQIHELSNVKFQSTFSIQSSAKSLDSTISA